MSNFVDVGQFMTGKSTLILYSSMVFKNNGTFRDTKISLRGIEYTQLETYHHKLT